MRSEELKSQEEKYCGESKTQESQLTRTEVGIALPPEAPCKRLAETTAPLQT